MESSTYTAKRKKRKTRKCLDELRKRSRRNTVKTSPLTENTMRETKKEMFVTKSTYLTSSRLTLAMFPKAIRSETVTRPMYAEHESETHSVKPLNNISSVHTAAVLPEPDLKETTDGGSECIQQSEDSAKVYKRYSTGQVTPTNKSDKENNRDSSVESCLLFSPGEDAMRHIDLFEETQNEAPTSKETSPTLDSSEASEGSYNYNLYDEFMKEVPLYLKENVPALLKEDVTKKARAYLHTVYLESCRQECENNILQCIKSNMLSVSNKPGLRREAIVQNPMDYLRLGYAWCQNKGGGGGAPTSSPGSPRSPTASPGSPSPRAPRSPHSPAFSPDSPATPPATQLGPDTPDYDYYPHRLNQ